MGRTFRRVRIVSFGAGATGGEHSNQGRWTDDLPAAAHYNAVLKSACCDSANGADPPKPFENRRCGPSETIPPISKPTRNFGTLGKLLDCQCSGVPHQKFDTGGEKLMFTRTLLLFSTAERECVVYWYTQFSNLNTAVDMPAKTARYA
jgi:hypothetical protein